MTLSPTVHQALEPAPQALRAALGQFATGVTIVTCLDCNDIPIGLTANSFSALSLAPPLVLWSLRVNSPSLPAFRAASHFGINVLAADQIGLSQRFASQVADKFALGRWETGLGGVPVLAQAPAVLECERLQEQLMGDHVLFVGQVRRLSGQGGAPLLFHGGQYHALGGAM